MNPDYDPTLDEIEVPEKSPPPPRPKLEEVQAALTALKIRASERNRLITMNRRVVHQAADTRVRIRMNDDEDVRERQLNFSIPHTVVSEATRVLARMVPQPLMPLSGETDEDTKAVELPEAFCRWVLKKFQEKTLLRGDAVPFIAKAAQDLVQDGRLVAIWRPAYDNEDFPWTVDIVDYTTMYFDYGAEGVNKAYREVSLTRDQVLASFPGIELDKDDNLNTTYNVVAYYDDTYLGVFIENKDWVKFEEHEMGFMPVMVFHYNGNSHTMSDAITDDPKWGEANRGKGIFWPHVEEYTEYMRVKTIQIYDTIYNGAPTIIKKLGADRQNFKAEVEPDGSITVPQGGNVEFLEKNQSIPHTAGLTQDLQNLIQSGLFNLGIDQQQFASGQDRWVSDSKNKGFYSLLLETLGGFYSILWKRALELYRDTGIPMTILDRNASGRLIRRQFAPELVPQDPIVEVQFGDLADQDLLKVVSVMTPALASGVIDPYTVWRDVIKHPDAAQIVRRIEEYKSQSSKQVEQQEAMLNAFTRFKKRAEDAAVRGDVEEAELAKQMATQLYQQIMGGLPTGDGSGILNTNQPPPPVPIPGLPGGNGSNGLPVPPVPGMPSEAMPPAAMDDGLSQLLGGMYGPDPNYSPYPGDV